MVVGADPGLVQALQFLLTVEGFRVTLRRSVEDALSGDPPDGGCCLIVDDRLPGLVARELVDQLRSRSLDCPAFLIAGQAMPPLWRAAAEAGVYIIEKPLIGQALVDGVRRAYAGGEPI